MSDPAYTSNAFEIASKIMISVVIIFFIMISFIFLLHLYARCLWPISPEDPEIVAWRRQLAAQYRSSEVASRRRKGLDSSTLKSLPVVVYNPKEFKDGLECSICLSELQKGENVRILPNCNHGFHLNCIDKWFSSHSTCPICRTLVVAGSVEVISVSNPVESQQDEGNDVNSSGQSVELPAFPTNVLFWGDEVRVRTSVELSFEEGVSSSESLVIDIPTESESCSNADNPDCTSRVGVEDESKSPVANRLRSLKRLLSRGKRVIPFPSSSTSGDTEQV